MTETGSKKRFAFSCKLGTDTKKNNELPKGIKDKLEFLKTNKESIKQSRLTDFINKKSNLLESYCKKGTTESDSDLLGVVSKRTADLVNKSHVASPKLSNLLKKSSSVSSNSNGTGPKQFFKTSSEQTFKPLSLTVEKSTTPPIKNIFNTNMDDDFDFDAINCDDIPLTSTQRFKSLQEKKTIEQAKSPPVASSNISKNSNSQPEGLFSSKPASSNSISSNSQPLSSSGETTTKKKFKFGRPKGKFEILIPFEQLNSKTRINNSVSVTSLSTITSTSPITSNSLHSNAGNLQTSTNLSSSNQSIAISPMKQSHNLLKPPEINSNYVSKEKPMVTSNVEDQERFVLANINWDDEDLQWNDCNINADETLITSPPKKEFDSNSTTVTKKSETFITPGDYVDDDFDFSQLGVIDSPPRSSLDKPSTSTENQNGKNSIIDLNDDDIDWNSFNEEFEYNPHDSLNDSMARFVPVDKDNKTRKDNTAEFQKEYPHSMVLRDILHEKFGLKQFRPNQQEIINATLEQFDCFVLMPTGGGKSLCYQLPAIITPGVTIVISPLRALIVDQVNKLNSLDIPAAHMCSDISRDKHNEVMGLLTQLEPTIKLLYLTPEKIVASKQTFEMLLGLYKRGKLARIVLDEAHCLSQWGHDFRPDYKQLKTLKINFPKTPIMCLTATATNVVQQDVINILKLKNVKTFIRSFNRSNIKYAVLEKSKAIAAVEIIKLILTKFKRMSGIVYCLVRKDCDTLAQDLRRNGIKAKAYHAGLTDKVREQVQSQWMNNEYHVIVATIAFGMGIDKPDVRFVIHNSMPKSIEAFYQESGRGGRDGELAYSFLFYAYSDVVRLQRIIQMDKSIKKNSLDAHFDQIQQMAQYSENKTDCRRYLQLLHLGEKFDRKLCMQDKKTMCDNCASFGTIDVHDVTRQCQELATLIKDIGTNRNFTMLHFVDIYKGSKVKKIMEWKHNTHKFYGAGAHLDKTDIQRILKELSFKKVLMDVCQYSRDFPIIYVKPGPNFSHIFKSDVNISIPLKTKGRKPSATNANKVETSDSPDFIDEPPAFKQIAETKTTKVHKTTSNDKTPPSPQKSPEMRIFSLKVKCHEELLEKCAEFASQNQSNLSSIMNLSAIKVMSEELPATAEDFLKIQYVTKANFEKFGKAFLVITQKYKNELNKIEAESALSNLDADLLMDDWDSNTSTGSAGTSRGTKRKYLSKRGSKKKFVRRF